MAIIIANILILLYFIFIEYRNRDFILHSMKISFSLNFIIDLLFLKLLVIYFLTNKKPKLQHRVLSEL